MFGMTPPRAALPAAPVSYTRRDVTRRLAATLLWPDTGLDLLLFVPFFELAPDGNADGDEAGEDDLQ